MVLLLLAILLWLSTSALVVVAIGSRVHTAYYTKVFVELMDYGASANIGCTDGAGCMYKQCMLQLQFIVGELLL